MSGGSRRLPFALLLGVATGLACGAAGKPVSPTPAPTPASAATGPRVEMPSGAVYGLDLAKTPEDQAQGLMFRESLPERYGMLFLFPNTSVHKFWMKNTMIPLDMIWLDGAGKVLFINANTPPCKADPCPSYGPDEPASSVLELAGGRAAKEKIVSGSMLKFSDVNR